MDYPSWLYEVFYKFDLIYAEAWNRNMPTVNEREAMLSIYFKALDRFKSETIIRAVDKYLETYKYPELHQLVSLCEEFAKTNRYIEFKYDDDNPQSGASPLVDQYMKNNKISAKEIEEAKAWFYRIREDLRRQGHG